MRRVVSFHFTLRGPDGRVLDTSLGGEPVRYLEGAGQIIDGLDRRLRTIDAGGRVRVTIPPAEAYGERDASQVQAVRRELLPVEGDLRPGDQFQAGEDRYAPLVTVVRVDGDEVTLDANHPLAGVTLDFDVEVVAARAATDAELAHGHAHADDGRCG